MSTAAVAVAVVLFGLESLYEKRIGRQCDSPGRHWRRWNLPSTSPVTTRAVTLTTFPFLWVTWPSYGASNHRQLDYLLKKISKCCNAGPLWGKPRMTCGLSSQRARNSKRVFMSLYHHHVTTVWGRQTAATTKMRWRQLGQYMMTMGN